MILKKLDYCHADTNQDGFVNEKNNIKYSGYFYDGETELYYLNARFYDPETARFLQEDTYNGDPNDPLSLNLYAYCANNPLVYYDPTGHNYIEIFGIPFGNPLEGLKILSDPQKREEAYDLIEEHGDLNFAEKRFYSLVTGYGEISAGMIKTGRDVLDSGYVQKPMLEAGRKLGFIDDDLVYEIMKEEIDDKLERNKKTLKNAPKAIYNGIIESASNVVNKENAYNFFINPDTSFNELVDYSRDTISTGLTVYGGAKMLQSGHNLLKSIRVETIPSAVTSFGQITPSTLSVTIDAGLAGNLARSAGFLGGINFATTNNKGAGSTGQGSNLDNQTREQLLKSKSSYEKPIQEHKAKLQDYINNPDAYDNLGLLKNVSPDVRQKIIDGRIKALEKQIQKQIGE